MWWLPTTQMEMIRCRKLEEWRNKESLLCPPWFLMANNHTIFPHFFFSTKITFCPTSKSLRMGFQISLNFFCTNQKNHSIYKITAIVISLHRKLPWEHSREERTSQHSQCTQRSSECFSTNIQFDFCIEMYRILPQKWTGIFPSCLSF